MKIKCPYCRTEFHHKKRDVITCPACKEMFFLSEEQLAEYKDDDIEEDETYHNVYDIADNIDRSPQKKYTKKDYDLNVCTIYSLSFGVIGLVCTMTMNFGPISFWTILIELICLLVSIHYSSIVWKYGEKAQKIVAGITKGIAIVLSIFLFLMLIGMCIAVFFILSQHS